MNYDRRNTNAVIRRNSYVLLVIIMTDVIVFGHVVIFDIGLFNLAEKYSRNIMKVDDLSTMFWRISGIVHNEVGILGGKSWIV